ncbi:hypothetical protein C4D60_Mb01t21960 [Musa balbisiana]|uniref:D-aminoacyl-tRNA deacylase n=1 Tax=Musa balbisiana TaxID=52838 RepID=A0A4S8JQH1_MUSBA|nr:hypothetical protein C4D60_Mb01t21960 [Musa balbisiana]
MVTLVVATAADPASIGPASAFLAMPGWNPGPSIAIGMESFANGSVRLLKHERSIVAEDDLDRRWEAATEEPVDEVIFLSRHTAVSNRPALTVHPIGVPHIREGEPLPQGGRPCWAGPPNPRVGPWLRLMKKIAEANGLIPEFEITLEATHHGPVVNTPTMFLEIGILLWKDLVLEEGAGTYGGSIRYTSKNYVYDNIDYTLWGQNIEKGLARTKISHIKNNGDKVLLGIGGGHYVPRHMDIVWKDGVWVGHLLSGYSLPMEDPNQKKGENGEKCIGGAWKQAIKVSYEATKLAFPGGEVIAHLDHKSFKGWQKNAITSFLTEENIKIGKPQDFY